MTARVRLIPLHVRMLRRRRNWLEGRLERQEAACDKHASAEQDELDAINAVLEQVEVQP